MYIFIEFSATKAKLSPRPTTTKEREHPFEELEMEGLVEPLRKSAQDLKGLADYIDGANTEPLDQSKKYAVDSLAAVAFQVNAAAKGLSRNLDQQIQSCQHASLSIDSLTERMKMCAAQGGRKEFSKFAPTKREKQLRANWVLRPQDAPHTAPLRGSGFVRAPMNYDALDRLGTGVQSARLDMGMGGGGGMGGSGPGDFFAAQPAQQPPAAQGQAMPNADSIYGSLEVTSRATSMAPTESLYEDFGALSVPQAPVSPQVPQAPRAPSVPQAPTTPSVPQAPTTPQPPQHAAPAPPTSAPPPPPPAAPTQAPPPPPTGTTPIGDDPLYADIPEQEDASDSLYGTVVPSSVDAPPPPPPAAPPAPPGDDEENPYGIVAPMVQPPPPPPATGPPKNVPRQVLCKAVVQYDYVATADDELDLSEDQEVEVLMKNEDGWFLGRVAGTEKEGLFPGNYVEEVDASNC